MVHRAAAPSTVSTPPPTTLPVTEESTSTSTTRPDETTTAPPSNGCTNQQASQAIDAELVQANGSPGGETVPGSVYYGVCGSTSYAVARFQPSPTATPEQANSFQDEGAAPHYFMEASGESWKLVTDGANFPQHMRDCSTFTQLPEALRTLWQDCPNG